MTKDKIDEQILENDGLDNDSEQRESPVRNRKRYLIYAVLCLMGVFGIIAALLGYVYASSPAQIRKPTIDHYHFRMQILVDGKAEDFSTEKYQEPYAKDQCNADLPDHPVHFHDQKDQFVHVHWDNMTGGLVLKYYGWNKVGGIDGALGYRFDSGNQLQRVPVRGATLPVVGNDAKYYVYTGDQNGYKERSIDDFTNQNLEEFFGKKSNLPTPEEIKTQTSFLDRLFPKVSAHQTGEVHDEGTAAPQNSSDSNNTTETQDEKLTRINNLLGNVVIFVQNDKPSDEQIKARFNVLAPLTESTCGG